MTSHTWIATLLCVMTLAPATGLASEGLVGAGEAALPAGAELYGVQLIAVSFGTGVRFADVDPASGHLQATLHGVGLDGLARDIEIEAEISMATSAVTGGTVLSGVAEVDPGDGTPAQTGVAFSATLTSDGLALTVGGTVLPFGALTDGAITFR